jgi:hypothetical protein
VYDHAAAEIITYYSRVAFANLRVGSIDGRVGGCSTFPFKVAAGIDIVVVSRRLAVFGSVGLVIIVVVVAIGVLGGRGIGDAALRSITLAGRGHGHGLFGGLVWSVGAVGLFLRL